FGEATRPLLADVFLKMATISLWDDDPGKATASLAKARSLHPGFEPDPALYSPRFRELWAGAGSGLPAEAEILIESVPPGARIFIDRQERGVTPRRLKLPAAQSVDLRLEHPGYRASASTRQWLPGDSERIEVLLDGDREARLAAFLENPAPRIPEAAPIVSEMAAEYGSGRIAILMLDRKPAGEEVRILAASASDPVPRTLGTIRIADSGEGMSTAASGSASLLAGDGWPVRPGEPAIRTGRPWYHSWWFLTGVGLLAAGTAVALSRGGGDDGASSTSTSSTNVNF
ncbi:MAG TPA: PEGA domain-containing protein, partial [Candidatus Deferrimicrobiaceae bacterium]